MKQSIRFATQVAWIVLCLAAVASTQNVVISIDNVTNELYHDGLIAGRTHVASIRYDATNLTGAWWAGNQYEIWSPDGADWVRFEGQSGPAVPVYPAVARFARHYESVDRTNPDLWVETVVQPLPPDTLLWVPAGGSQGINSGAAYSLVITAAGFSGGTNDIGVTLTFETRIADIGKTMCIDSATYHKTWCWAGGSLTEYPLWDNGLGVSGPRCWEIVECCQGRVGDANLVGGDEPTIGDVSIMIDAKFISGTCDGILSCLDEADVNQSATGPATCDDITVGDISVLIDYLFITGQTLVLPDCM